MATRTITTKLGDQGFSRLFSGEKVPKDSPRLDTYGDLDELVSLLSIARHCLRKKYLAKEIIFLQRSLFVVGSELATSPKKISKLKVRMDASALEILEQKREILEGKVKIPQGFVIPGNSLSSAYLDYSRSIARRLERKVVTLLQKGEINNTILLVWLNRLSDYLYLLARCEEKKPLLVRE